MHAIWPAYLILNVRWKGHNVHCKRVDYMVRNKDA
jgi:hypothetical protein